MKLKVATTFSEIIEGWRLVYNQYVKAALIDVNPFSIFTYPEYIGRNTAVILGKIGKTIVCSVSAVLDSNKRLPLDAYFHEELNGLRRENKNLIEIGLLANNTERATPIYIIELLSSIAHFGVYSNFHDYVIGVHPRRSNFFKYFFGFNQIGESKKYDKLHHADVILLHANGQQFETLAQKASHAVYFEETDLEFKNRFKFITMASLKPFIAFSQIVSYFKKLRNQMGHSKRRIATENELVNLTIMTSFSDPVLRHEHEKHHAKLNNLRIAFDMSEYELAVMLKDEHFNHQY